MRKDYTCGSSPQGVGIDRAVEELLRQELRELRPGDAILGEELGHTGHHDHHRSCEAAPHRMERGIPPAN